MRQTFGSVVAAASLALLATTGQAAQGASNCKGSLTINGRTHALPHCALAVLPGPVHSVTLLATAEPLSRAEADAFTQSAYHRGTRPDGSQRTMVMLSFCAGRSAPDAVLARKFGVDISVAGNPMQGRVRSLPDPQGQVRVKRLAGSFEPGKHFSGALEGRITDSDRFTLELEWSLPVPQQQAASGLSCD